MPLPADALPQGLCAPSFDNKTSVARPSRLSTLGMAAKRLSHLMAAVEQEINDEATERLVAAACLLVGICCMDIGAPQPLPHFMSCIQLLLRCGAAAQRFLVSQALNHEITTPQLLDRLLAQTWALSFWQLRICEVRPSARAAAVAEACAPTPLLLQWARGMVAVLLMCMPSSWRLGGRLGHGSWAS